MKKILFILITFLIGGNIFSQQVIEGVSESNYVYLPVGDNPPDIPCEGENLQITLNSYPKKTNKGQVKISGIISGVKKSITNITINGKTISENKKNFNTVTKLNAGENKLTIKAYSSCDNNVEKTISIYRDLERTDYALFFVIDNPGNDYTKIPNAVKDAKKLDKVLSDDYGFKTEIFNNPTEKEFNETIEEYASKTYNKNDQLLVYLVGHGDVDRIGDNITENYFVLKNKKITQTKFTNSINAIEVNHILFIANTCYSGASVIQSQFKPYVEEELTIDEKINDYLKRKKTRKIIAAGNELVPSGYDSHPLINKMIRYLLSNTDKIINFQDLANNITNFKYTSGTKPIYGHFGDDAYRTTFIFVPKNIK